MSGHRRRASGIGVNVTTRNTDSDTTCALEVGDHSFIAHASVIFYNDARELDLALLKKAVEGAVQSCVCYRYTGVPCVFQ